MATKSDYAKVFILRTVGNFFLFSALAGVVLTFAPAAEAEFTYRYNQFIGQKYVVAGDVAPKPKPEDNLLSSVPPLSISPLDPNFDVIIPKLGANAKVIANVDPGNAEDYLEALKHGVAHAAGTVMPGETGNSVLFAHSVGNFWEVNRWNAVFYLLRELEPGDEVDVFFQGKRIIYEVYDKRIVDPSDVKYLDPQANFAKLTLQTCWPPGTTLKRLLVFARLR